MYNTAIKLLKRIEKAGFSAYIVGGYPRDLYMNNSSTDIDICTSATPKDLQKIFTDEIISNENYGSVVIKIDKLKFEVTTFRRDIKSVNSRHPEKVEYINNLYEDLMRRDFTINTICMDENGTIIDLLDARKDIDNKVIKMVGDPYVRLKEDALRILRAIRFATRFNFNLDSDLKKAIIENKNLLRKLSYNRKKEELDYIFSSSNAEYGIDLIKELKLASPLELKNFNSLVVTYADGIWAQLDVLDKYPFRKHEKVFIQSINELKDKNILDVDIMYKYKLELISIVADIRGIDRNYVVAAYNSLPIKSINDISLKPEDIMSLLNKKSGPYMKMIMTDLEYKILHGDLENDIDTLKDYVLKNYKGI